MVAKKEVVKEVKNVENVEHVEEGRISLMPNWENTHTWLLLCRQILSQRVKTPTATALLKKVDKAETEKEKFCLMYSFADEQIKFYEKRIETLKSVSEIANYETSICMKRDDKV